MKRHATIHTDGGARGNPGPAAIGIVIESAGRIYTYKEFIGKATNNQAEYRALFFALEKARDLGIQTADVYLDSELLVNQLNRVYKVKDKELASLFVRVWNISLIFQKIKYHHIPREENSFADRLVNEALDKKEHS